MLPFLSQPAAAPACHLPTETIAHSQVFGDNKWLSRTPSVAGNIQKWSWGRWVMPNPDGTEQCLLSAYVDINNFAYFSFDPQGRLTWYERYANTTYWGVMTQARFRDSAPLHALIEYDTAASTPVADRVRIYVNGTRQAVDNSFGTTYADDWPGIVNRTVEHRIGRDVAGYTHHLRGMIAEDILLSGATPGPTAWGEFNIHGVWVPKALAFTAADYGVTGHRLDFALPLTPGNDASGKGNHWTANGFDAAGKDTVASSPTNVYATWNPLAVVNMGVFGTPTYTNGNRTATASGNVDYIAPGSLPMLVPTYFEIKVDAVSLHGVHMGVIDLSRVTDSLAGAAYFNSGADTFTGVNTVAVASGFGGAAAGDVFMFCFDPRFNNLWIGKNGLWLKGGNPAALTAPICNVGNGRFAPYSLCYYDNKVTLNCGQAPFAYSPPAGFLPLCTDNFPEPEVKDPTDGFACHRGSGASILALLNASSAHWGGAAYVEILKRCEAVEDWRLRFSDDPANSWASNTANAKAAAPALAATGSYVGYRLRVGHKYGVWTGEVVHVTGTATTITHGLGAARNAVIVTRVSSGGGDRYFRHPDMVSGHLARLNSTALAATDGTLTAMAADSFQIAAAAPSGTYRVVVLAQRDGYLDLGKYIGNGAVNGAFGSMTVSPLLVITKATTGTAGGHSVMDAARSPSNPVAALLSLDNLAAESSGTVQADMVVGGLKLRAATAAINTSGTTYCTIAIGRPIGGVCVAPATAR